MDLGMGIGRWMGCGCRSLEGRQIRQGPVAVGAIALALVADALTQLRHQPEVGRHRLELLAGGGGDEVGEGADHRGDRQLQGLQAPGQAGRVGARQPPPRHRRGVALGARDLARRQQAGPLAELQAGVQQLRRLQEGVAVHHAVPHELRLLQPGDQPQHPRLLPPLEVGLEPHQIPEAAVPVLLPQLHHGVGPLGPTHLPIVDIPPAGIPEPDRLEGAIAHGVLPPPRQLLDRQAALEEAGALLVKVLELGLLRRQQRRSEGRVLRLIHRAVDVIGVALVVAAGPKGHGQVDGVAVHNRTGGIEEVAVGPAGELPQLLRQAVAGEGTGGKHGDLVGGRQGQLFPPLHRHQGMVLQGGREGGAIAAPIHRQGAAGGNGMVIGGADHQGAQPP